MDERYAITLRIRHPTLTAPEICAAIPLQPGRTWSVGTPRTTPRGAPLAGLNPESYCTFAIDEGVGDPANALARAVERLAPQHAILREIGATGGSAEFFVGWFFESGNAGARFGPALLARLGDLGLGLDLDLYEVSPESA